MLWSVLGDLDYLCKIMRLPRSTLEKGPCPLCKCTGKGLTTWLDFRDTAPWRGLQWDACDWHAWEDRSACPLFRLLPRFSPWAIALDWMHCKYLGHDVLVYGSVLSLLTRYVCTLGVTREQHQADLARRLLFLQKNKTPCQFRYLNRCSMFERKSGYPKLRGKAAEIKYFCRPIHYVRQKYSNPRLGVHRQIGLYLQMNCQIEEILILNRQELALPEEDAKKFQHLCAASLLLLSDIAEHFITDQLFGITQKAHFTQHISLLAKFLSPRLTWCFEGEDVQRKISTLAKTCVGGERPGQTIGKMMSRYRLGLRLQFEKHGREKGVSMQVKAPEYASRSQPSSMKSFCTC